MSSVYARLGFNFDTNKFDGADTLSTPALNLLGNTAINLSQWQIDDIANNTVSGYYVNPHNDTLGILSVFVAGLHAYANTDYYSYPDSNTANLLYTTTATAETSLSNFAIHTNNLSGVTRSSNTAIYPDLTTGLAVGRQVLNIVNKTDGVQNNTPILGNFTSLYIGDELLALQDGIANDYITISGSITGNTSNISNSALSSAVSNVANLMSVVDTQRNNDITFYGNCYKVMQDYQTAVAFSYVGDTQNNLIKLIGTDKLKADLANNEVIA